MKNFLKGVLDSIGDVFGFLFLNLIVGPLVWGSLINIVLGFFGYTLDSHDFLLVMIIALGSIISLREDFDESEITFEDPYMCDIPDDCEDTYYEQHNFEDVQDFHCKFEVPTADTPTFLDEEAYNFRVKFLQEEFDEFKKAHAEKNMEDAGDALIDLVYVALGTADMMGLPWQEMWDEVQRANMSKVRATSAEESKRGTALDVIKPEGWTPPNHTPILEAAGYQSSSGIACNS